MNNHIHTWHLVRTFIAEGEPKVMQQVEPVAVGSTDAPKVKTWVDARQEYCLYHCTCGESKSVAI